jgi:hypothetical protein
MKRGFGIVLVGLGAFLLVLAGLLRFYVVPQLAKAPLVPGESTGGISTTTNEGVAEKLFDPGALASGGDPNRTNVVAATARREATCGSEGNTTECPAKPTTTPSTTRSRTSPTSRANDHGSTIRVSFDRCPPS